ncbi:tetratricopeptide repeat protein 39B-like protein [Dinothrombium tinctorium]|uniref:Tetratricopeptide repeat protein 39B-like protein n=1 Tax=Dinothrombium tinctorium TaxID=1965070 RepID=A0A443QP67_9ACAR|nr:tetratricopeptide repeat protein 39B-like protein [Dinothrombium tinctorium]RWS04823.1 tetratricopeptide repeat protein 39B-like protein [Dinothrombium tinctorium]RWS04846.1 tetratricopeptide repeat protein 39B-like protein [Dinothrombium tinctorium]
MGYNSYRNNFYEWDELNFNYSKANDDEILSRAIKIGNYCADLFYMNKFDELFAIADRNLQHSLYHCHGKSSLLALYALLSLERNEVDNAKEAIKKTLTFCQLKRRNNSIAECLASFIWQTDFNLYSDYELHAELIYAESQTLMAMLTVFDDQHFISLIKAAFYIRAANRAYKFCYEALQNKNNWKSDEIRLEFESGVCTGHGGFNLFLSLLPEFILRLLSLAGFTGDYRKAITLLKRSTELKQCSRYRLAASIVKIFTLYISRIIGHCYYDREWAFEFIDELKSKFPNAIFVLIFSATFNMREGNLDEAIEEFHKCIDLKDSWKQVHNLCRWELIWAYAIKQDWKNAAEQAKLLFEHCTYSPASNAYQFAVFRMLQMETEGNDKLKEEINEAMKLTPKLVKRYAGFLLPPEEFSVWCADRYLVKGLKPIIALLSLFYAWNVFALINDRETIEIFLKRTNETLKVIENCDSNEKDYDEIASLLLVKGVLLRNAKEYEEAISCLKRVIEMKDSLVTHTFLPPHAALEAGITYFDMGNYNESRKWLCTAKSIVKSFRYEIVVHARVHAFMKKINEFESSSEVLA